jgi:hypothetical protein
MGDFSRNRPSRLQTLSATIAAFSLMFFSKLTIHMLYKHDVVWYNMCKDKQIAGAWVA